MSRIGNDLGTDALEWAADVFAKTKYLAGFLGLAEDRADPIARQLAARLY
jgi:hypothetical protein